LIVDVPDEARADVAGAAPDGTADDRGGALARAERGSGA
jgi:hypothetical protein